MIETIAKLVQPAPAFSVTEPGETIHQYFEENRTRKASSWLTAKKPAGLLMRNDFYQKIGSQFGYSVYMKRNVKLIMKADIVCVDVSCDMARFGLIAMNRDKTACMIISSPQKGFV